MNCTAHVVQPKLCYAVFVVQVTAELHHCCVTIEQCTILCVKMMMAIIIMIIMVLPRCDMYILLPCISGKDLVVMNLLVIG